MAIAHSWHLSSSVLGRYYCHCDPRQCPLHVTGTLPDAEGK